MRRRVAAFFSGLAAAGALLAGTGFAQTAGTGGAGAWRREAFVPTAAPARLGEFEDTTVSAFGYATKWKRLGWAAYPHLQARFPAAHLGASLQEKAFAVIVPLYLGDLRAEMDAICGGFRSLLPVSDALMENQQPGIVVRELNVNGRPARDMRWFRWCSRSMMCARSCLQPLH